MFTSTRNVKKSEVIISGDSQLRYWRVNYSIQDISKNNHRLRFL